MFGNLLSTVIDVATLPLDITNATLDKISGGSGRKESRKQIPVLGDLEEVRDIISEEVEEI